MGRIEPWGDRPGKQDRAAAKADAHPPRKGRRNPVCKATKGEHNRAKVVPLYSTGHIFVRACDCGKRFERLYKCWKCGELRTHAEDMAGFTNLIPHNAPCGYCRGVL